MKKLLLILLMVFLIGSVSALTIKETAINDVIVLDFNQPAKLTLTITGAEPGSYNLYTLTEVKLMPPNSFNLGYGTNEVDVYVYPTDQVGAIGFYSFTYNLKKLDGENFQDTMTVKIVDLEDAIEINSDSNDPDADKISFYVRNNENAKLRDLKAKFSSIFFNIEKEFDLEPYEKLEIEVDVDKEEMKKIEAGSYIIEAEFETDKGLKLVKGKIYLGVKKGIETAEDSSGILIHTHSMTKINVGNVLEIVDVEIKKNFITRLFTSFNHEPDIVDRNRLTVTYIWHKQLNPAEVFVVKAKTNYIFPLLILIFAGLLILGFKRYMETNIDIKKSVTYVRTKGKHFALKVHLLVKAKKSVGNVSLIDKIPAIVKVYEKFGLVKPSKIDAKNRRIQWDIGDLNAGEVRIFSYIIYSKVGIVGKFSLPEALAVFEKEDKIHEIKSNKVFFLSEQTSKDE